MTLIEDKTYEHLAYTSQMQQEIACLKQSDSIFV